MKVEMFVYHFSLTHKHFLYIQYVYIRADKENGGTLWQHTRHKLKHRKYPLTGKQVIIKNKVSIENRPDIVNSQGRYGNWEIDTIIGKDQQGAILTLTERKTDFLIMRKSAKKNRSNL